MFVSKRQNQSIESSIIGLLSNNDEVDCINLEFMMLIFWVGNIISMADCIQRIFVNDVIDRAICLNQTYESSSSIQADWVSQSTETTLRMETAQH